MNTIRRFKKLLTAKRSEVGTVVSISSNKYAVRTSTGIVLASKLDSVRSLAVNDSVKVQNQIIVKKSRIRNVITYHV